MSIPSGSLQKGFQLHEMPQSQDTSVDEKPEGLSEDETESTQSPSTYQMRPGLDEVFKSGKIKEIIQLVLAEKLQGKTYNPQDAKVWTKQIADEVNTSIHELSMKRYKHVVQVTLGQQLGSGCRYVARCRWDAESDNYTSEIFTNATLFCVCTVFGVYLY